MTEDSKKNSCFGISSAKAAFSGIELLIISECAVKIKKGINFRNVSYKNRKGIIIFAILPKTAFSEIKSQNGKFKSFLISNNIVPKWDSFFIIFTTFQKV